MTPEEWIAAYAQAWRSKDDVGVTSLFTDDASYRSDPTTPPDTGKEAIGAYWRRATATQQELDLRFSSPVANGTVWLSSGGHPCAIPSGDPTRHRMS